MKAALTLISVVSLAGCSTMQTFKPHEFSGNQETFSPGEELLVVYKNGDREHVLFERMDEQRLYTESGEIPLAEVFEIKAEKFDAGETLKKTAVGTGVAIGVVVLTAVFVLGAMAAGMIAVMGGA